MESPNSAAAPKFIIINNDNNTTSISTAHSSSSSDSVEVVHDSPFFSYISNLSPIKPVKAAPVAQGFLGLNSPPLVFTSPQINGQSQSNLLKRPQFQQLPNVVSSRQDDTSKVASTNADEKSYSQTSVGLILSTEKKHENDFCGHNQCGSASGRVDDFLNDFVVIDCAGLTNSANSNPKNFNGKPLILNGSADSEDSAARPERKDNLIEFAPSAILEHAKEVCEGKSLFNNTKLVKVDGKQIDIDKQSSLCPQIDCVTPVNCALQRQDHGRSEAPGVGSNVELKCVSQLLPGSVLTASEDCSKAIQELSDEPGEKTLVCGKPGKVTQAISTEVVKGVMPHDLKASQKHGTRRRCLQFEDVQLTENIPSASNPSGIAASPRSTPIIDSDVLESSWGNKSATSRNMQSAGMAQPMFSTLSNVNFSTRSSRPFGIGLHLNSIVNAMPVSGSARTSLKSGERGSVNVRGRKSASTMNCDMSENIENYSSLGNVTMNVSASTRDGWSESQNLLTGSSATSLSPSSVDSFNPVLFQPVEPQTTLCDKRKFNSELADNVEEFNVSSPKKKRKKTLETSDGDGCKRCSCKRTKCLKLYCDCFAAGIYCAEPCACQDCFNRPDYEDTVLETRQQIESRNPLAFAPKIVQHVNEPLANNSGEEVANLTPSSARHKRGCNCKKSMCLKKYCECYQASVGCSDGCRCEGCKNVYGRKQEYAMRKEMVSKANADERLESSLDNKPEVVATRYGSLQSELYSRHNLTPLTPSFECSDHGKDASKSRSQSGRFLQSPDSDLHFLAPYGKLHGPCETLNNYDMIWQTRKDIIEVSLDNELDYGHSERRDNFAANCHALGNVGHLSELPNPPSLPIGFRGPLWSGSGQVTSSGSLRWRGSPITPLTRAGETKVSQVLASCDKLYDIIEDKSPEFLKETPTLLNVVKASSPNSKQVSPPNRQLRDAGASSSAVLRTGRKFILQAVPSFPPLTPCIDSKGSTTQTTTIHP